MKKSLLLGAMAFAASAAVTTAASAKSGEFGFYTADGGAYCDGVMYSGAKPATGYHIYDQTYCPYTNEVLGGFRGDVKGLGKGEWYTFPVSGSSSAGEEYIVFTFYINPKALEWVLYYESTDYGIPFSLLNEGVLQKGAPFAMVHPGAKHLGSVIRESMAKLKK